jgi:hypothetical protein
MPRPLSPAFLVAAASALAARPAASRHRDEDEASVAFINDAGRQAHLDHATGESSWPLPRVRRAMELARIGRETGTLHEWPQEGDIALRWNAIRAAYDHAAIVAAVADHAMLPRGSIICRVLDALAPARARSTTYDPQRGDRFLRWVELEPGDEGRRRRAA